MSSSKPSPFLVSSLTSLPSQSIAEDTILATLRERYLHRQPYTSIGPSALVVLNPLLEDDQVYHGVGGREVREREKYLDEYYDLEDVSDRAGEGKAEPHVHRLATDAYFHMRRTGKDQGILISGESSSGKSHASHQAVSTIVSLSLAGVQKGKKGYKLGGGVRCSEFILETFGNARTHQNPNASRHGRYIELQFTSRGRLCGTKTLSYYLQKSLVSSIPLTSSGERNFHVFYYLVAGASKEERSHLMLGDAGSYRYLGNRFGAAARSQGAISPEQSDARRWEQLKEAFKVVGLSKRLVAQVCQLVAAILHLGNLDLIIDKGRNEESAVVRNQNELQIVADFLGVSPAALEGVLSYRTRMIRKELVTIYMDGEGAAANRDELANTLYSLLFSWLNEYINQKLCKDDFASFIGLLDLPGFQNMSGISSFRTNSLDQLVINYANERMQNWVLQKIFNEHNAELEQEGLTGLSPPVAFFDNSECLRLLDHQPGGLIHITDDQARRAPKKTEHTMAEAYSKRWGNHGSFKASGMDRTGYPSFTISHYGGPVTYSTEQFLEKNADAINPDFVSLLRGGSAHVSRGGGASATVRGIAQVGGPGSSNPFVQGLFTGRAIATEVHPHDDETLVAAQQPVKPMRAPSTRRKGGRIKKLASVGEEGEGDEYGEEGALVGGGNNEAPARGIKCVLGEFRSAMDLLYMALDETQPWYIFCLNPNDAHLPNQVETRGLRGQIRSLGLPEIVKKLRSAFEVSMTHEEGCDRYAAELNDFRILHGGHTPAQDSMKALASAKGWTEADFAVGRHKVLLSHKAFRSLENRLRRDESEERPEPFVDTDQLESFGSRSRGAENGAVAVKDGYVQPFHDDISQAALPLVLNTGGFRDPHSDYDDGPDERKSIPLESGNRYADNMSQAGTEAYAPSRNMFSNTEIKHVDEQDDLVLGNQPLPGEVVEEYRESGSRKRWVAIVWIMTWMVPSFLLSRLGRMKRPDIRMAWREKLAINMIIWFICGCAVFVIAILGNLICPREYVYSAGELAEHSYTSEPSSAYVSIRGEVFDLTSILPSHLSTVSVIPTKSIMLYSGLDASDIFPVQVSALCDGVDGSVSPWVTLDSTNTSDVNAQYHDFRASTNDSRPDWYYEQMVFMRYNFRVGFMGITPKEIKSYATQGRAVAIINGEVYEMSTYISQGGGGLKAPTGYQVPLGTSRAFMSSAVADLFSSNAGQDITNLYNSLADSLGADVLARQTTCLRNLFLIGKVDNRNSPQCLFSKYILLVLSIIMVAIIGFKFLAALHFGSDKAPENHDKFIICQVPCYTEGEESLRRTIDSLARLKYDDKRKLILVICDGNIIGSGNDRATPRIVLDILGSDPAQEPEPLSFLSLGEGAKQHNMGKVYSGLYECAGHVVPYLVIVKVGKPSERSRPGNRGKRDSQMLVMHFLNKVHYDSPMNPMELEMYHQVKNVIGVNPTFYEYIFTIDADTTVEELALNRLVSAMMHDKKIIAACGETSISNSKQSLITMMQVYEYFISHHLAKAFESLFNTVTCLPGCFSIYRLRTPDTHRPLFISNPVINDYSENRVDTLNKKNLLHLGEDRYLTTVLLKHFPQYKTKFVRGAHAATIAPDEFKVLLSQRRRWINSTVFNMLQLISADSLCGFCCFSMRFIVFIDLLSTIVAPVTVAYIVYLVVLVSTGGGTIPTFSIVMLAAIYGLQALIFIFRMRWDMVVWMIFYIMAIPLFSFFLPLYSFFRMDDFSWGSTRLVMNESGKKIVIHDEGKFDPKSIPLKSWNEYESELWENDSNKSLGSWAPPAKSGYADSRAASMYGRETIYEPGVSGGPFAGGTPPRLLSPSPSGNTVQATGQRPHSRQSSLMYGNQAPTQRGTVYNPYEDAQSIRNSPSGGVGTPPVYSEQYGQQDPQQRQPSFYANAFSQSAPFTPGLGDPMSPSYTSAPTGARPATFHQSSSYAPLLPSQNPDGSTRSLAQPRPASSFLPEPSAFLGTSGAYGMGGSSFNLGGNEIPDSELEQEIRIIVSQADLDQITKKGVRRQLGEVFGMDLSARKDTINALIEKILTE